jgi:hypothetical protein
MGTLGRMEVLKIINEMGKVSNINIMMEIREITERCTTEAKMTFIAVWHCKNLSGACKNEELYKDDKMIFVLSGSRV